MAHDTVPMITDSQGRVVNQVYNPRKDAYEAVSGSEGGVQIGTYQNKFRSDFIGANSTAPNTAKWDVIDNSTGRIVADIQTNELRFRIPVTAVNADEVIVRSKRIFTVAALIRMGFRASARVANTEFIMELVSVDAAGVPDGQDALGWRIAGSDTATQGRYRNQARGFLTESAVSTIATSASNSILELEAFTDEAGFHSRAMDSPNARSNSYWRQMNLPDPEGLYKVQIRARATGAVGTQTDFFVPFISIADHTELHTEITAGRGNISEVASVPVRVANAISTSITSFVPSNEVPVINNTNLGVGAAFASAIIDVGSTLGYQGMRVAVMHTAGLTPGHLVFEQSDTSGMTVVQETHRVPIPSDGVYRQFEFPVMHRYVRVRFVNGATAQTAFRISYGRCRLDTAGPWVKAIPFRLSSTNLAASASFTGPTLDTGGQSDIHEIRAYAYAAGNPGNLIVQQSPDNATWFTTGLGSVSAGGTRTLVSEVIMRYLRVVYTNDAGSTTTTLEVAASLLRG